MTPAPWSRTPGGCRHRRSAGTAERGRGGPLANDERVAADPVPGAARVVGSDDAHADDVPPRGQVAEGVLHLRGPGGGVEVEGPDLRPVDPDARVSVRGAGGADPRHGRTPEREGRLGARGRAVVHGAAARAGI